MENNHTFVHKYTQGQIKCLIPTYFIRTLGGTTLENIGRVKWDELFQFQLPFITSI